MKNIPIFTTVESTIQAITAASKKFAEQQVFAFKVLTSDEAVSVLKYELPEIKIIDFSDKNTNAQSYMDIIEADPWLLFGGVIAIVSKNSEKAKLEESKNPNFLVVITRNEFEQHVDKIIKILLHNEQFMYNRRSHVDTTETRRGCFVCETDIFEVKFYASLIGTYLYNANFLSESAMDAFRTTISELLFNAVEHGNCGISYEEKTAWLESGKNILDLIAEKRKNPEIAAKKIILSYEFSQESTKISIEDKGEGFDWKKRLQADFQAGLHGMGIQMSKALVNEIRYNEKGNKVLFVIKNQKNIANFTPAILQHQQSISYRHMQLVCREGEQSENLFYICSGRFAVYVNNKLLRVLTPQDIFLGEMAFLLDNKRTATIVSIGPGRLIKVDKIKFIELIEHYPHYGIFIAKLLAERLKKQSKDSSALKTKLSKFVSAMKQV